jgi:hypothetical protein
MSPKSTAPSAYDKLAAAKSASTPAPSSGPTPFFNQGGKLPLSVSFRPQQLTGQVTRDVQGRAAPSASNADIGAMYNQASAALRVPSALGNVGSPSAALGRITDPRALAAIQASALRRDAARAAFQKQVDAKQAMAQTAANATAQNWAYNGQQWADQARSNTGTGGTGVVFNPQPGHR